MKQKTKTRIGTGITVSVIAIVIVISVIYVMQPSTTPDDDPVVESLFHDVDASSWASWSSDGTITMSYYIYFGIVYGGGITTFPYKVTVNETVLAEKLGVSTLYLSNGSSIVFRGTLSSSPSTFAYVFHRATGWYAFPLGFPASTFEQSVAEQSITSVIDS